MQLDELLIHIGRMILAIVGYGSAIVLIVFASFIPAARKGIRMSEYRAGIRRTPAEISEAKTGDVKAVARLIILSMVVAAITVLILKVL